MRILIIGLNYAPELVGIAVYTSGLAEALTRRGHQIQVIAGKPYYPAWNVPPEFKGGWLRTDASQGFTIARVSHYVPSNPTVLGRILHHASFALSSLLPALAATRSLRPDVVLTIAPSLIAAPVAKFAAMISGAKSWLHIQDFEVEAAVATGMIGADNAATRLAFGYERAVLALFDQVSSISPAMCRKLLSKGVPVERITEFRNWADIQAIKPLDGVSPYREKWGITAKHVALYAGNVANKQGIEIILAAARRLRRRKDLMFVICGEGSNRAVLEAHAIDLTNVQFQDLQPKNQLHNLLGLATVHLLPQIAGAADLVLPSKLTNMLASGRPVIATALPETGLAHEVENCGVVVPPGDEAQFADAIENLIDDEPQRQALALAARRRAEERWEREAIIDRFEGCLSELTNAGKAEAIGRTVPYSG